MYSKAPWDIIREKVSELASTMLSTFNYDVDMLWNQLKLKSFILHLIDKYIPSKIARKRCSLPWITPNIRKLIRKQNKVHHRYKVFHSQDLLEKFKLLKHQVQSEIRKSYWSYISDMVSPTSVESCTSTNYKNSGLILKASTRMILEFHHLK